MSEICWKREKQGKIARIDPYTARDEHPVERGDRLGDGVGLQVTVFDAAFL